MLKPEKIAFLMEKHKTSAYIVRLNSAHAMISLDSRINDALRDLQFEADRDSEFDDEETSVRRERVREVYRELRRIIGV